MSDEVYGDPEEYDAAFVCACTDDASLDLIIKALTDEYDASPEVQAIRAVIDLHDYIEHGVAIRGSWKTEKGKTFLEKIVRQREQNHKRDFERLGGDQ